MTCPHCQAELSDVLWIGQVIVCPGCGKTWAREIVAFVDGAESDVIMNLVPATGAHIDALSADDLKTAKARRAGHYRRR